MHKYYKELLISSKNKKQIYTFKFNIPKRYFVSGYYVIDEYNKKWLSSCAIDSIPFIPNLDDLKEKYFNINKDRQLKFFLINDIYFEENQAPSSEFLFEIINTNHKKGTPRKFIIDDNGDKIDIRMSYEIDNQS